MGEEIIVKQGKKTEEGKDKARKAEAPGKMEESEVEGQAVYTTVRCPYCWGFNRVWDSWGTDYYYCYWCGGLFYV